MNDGRDNLPSLFGQDIAKGTRDLTNDSMGTKQAQAMGDACREAPLGWEVMLTWKEVVAKVPVSKALDVELSPADRFQEEGVLFGPGAKRTESLALPMGWAANRRNDLPQETVYLNRSECVQVPFIGSLRELGPAMEVGDPFTHSLPGRGTPGVPFFGAVNFKVARVIQGGLDAQNASFLVIDFNGVGLEFMLQTYAFRALGIMADDFSLEIAVEFLAQESHNLLAAKSGNAAAHQNWIDFGQGGGGWEHNIRSPFTLVRRPVVIHTVRGQHFFVGRVESPGNGPESGGPVGLQLLIHEPLGLGDIFNPGETVLAPLVAKADPVHLAGQPFPPIQADLEGKGKPTLKATVHEPKPGIHPVMVEKEAFSDPRLKFQLLLFFIPEDFVALTRLNRGQDTNQSLAQAILLGYLPGHLLLAPLWGGQIQDGTMQSLRLGQRGSFQLFAFLFTEAGKIFHMNSYEPEVVKHPAFDSQSSQSASQDQTVEPTQMADDILFILLYKPIHGVLLGVGVVEDSNHIPGVTPFSMSKCATLLSQREVIHSPGATSFN